MRTLLAAAAVTLALVACNNEGRTGGQDSTAMMNNADTSVTSSMVQDTTVVQHDTNVSVDTVKDTDHAPDSTR